MKTTTRVVLGIAVAMIVLGAGLSIMAWAISGGDIGVTWNPNRGFFRSSQGRVSSRLETGSENVGAFQSVHVETDYGHIKFIESDAYRVEYSLLANLPRATISVQNGELRILNSPSLEHGLNFNVFGWGPSGLNNLGDTAYIYVYYPADAKLTDITVENDMGGLDMRSLVMSGDLKLELAMGSVDLRDVQADRIEVNADMGSVDCKRVTAGFMEASLAMGSLDITDSTLGGLDANADMGSTVLTGDISGKISLDCAMGSITLETSRPRADFYLDVSADIGGVRADGEKLRSGVYGSSSLPNSITASCDMGDISLRFGR